MAHISLALTAAILSPDFGLWRTPRPRPNIRPGSAYTIRIVNGGGNISVWRNPKRRGFKHTCYFPRYTPIVSGRWQGLPVTRVTYMARKGFVARAKTDL